MDLADDRIAGDPAQLHGDLGGRQAVDPETRRGTTSEDSPDALGNERTRTGPSSGFQGAAP
jgi:hypothetical protein